MSDDSAVGKGDPDRELSRRPVLKSIGGTAFAGPLLTGGSTATRGSAERAGTGHRSPDSETRPVSAETPAPDTALDVDITQVSADDFPLVDCFSAVTDDTNDPITGLGADNFEIYEDGDRQSIRNARPVEDAGSIVNTALVIDRSASMENKIDEAKTGARQFVSNLGDDDRVAVYGLSETVTTVQDFTSDTEQINAAIDGLTADGRTALFDAVEEALEATDATTDRQAVIVLADGQNNEDPDGDGLTVSDVVSLADSYNVSIYTIGLVTEEFDGETLRRLATETGGDYYESPSPEALIEIYTTINESISSEYQVTYRSDAPTGPEETRTVEAVVEHDGGTSRAARSYTAPERTPTPTDEPTPRPTPELDVTIRNNFIDAQPEGFLDFLFGTAQDAVTPKGAGTGPDKDKAYINVDIVTTLSGLGSRTVEDVTVSFRSEGVSFGTTSLNRVSDTKYRAESLSIASQMQAGEGINVLDVQAVLSLFSLPGRMSGAPFGDAVQAKTSVYPDAYLDEVTVSYADGASDTFSVDRELPRYIDMCPENGFMSFNPLNYPKPECNLSDYTQSDLRRAEGVAVLSPASVSVERDDGRRSGRVATGGGLETVEEIPGSFYSGPLDHEFLLVPEGGSHTVRVHGTDSGVATIVKTRAVVRDGNPQLELRVFYDVPVDPGTTLVGPLASDVLERSNTDGESRISADETMTVDFETAFRTTEEIFDPSSSTTGRRSEETDSVFEISASGVLAGVSALAVGAWWYRSDDEE